MAKFYRLRDGGNRSDVLAGLRGLQPGDDPAALDCVEHEIAQKDYEAARYDSAVAVGWRVEEDAMEYGDRDVMQFWVSSRAEAVSTAERQWQYLTSAEKERTVVRAGWVVEWCYKGGFDTVRYVSAWDSHDIQDYGARGGRVSKRFSRR